MANTGTAVRLSSLLTLAAVAATLVKSVRTVNASRLVKSAMPAATIVLFVRLSTQMLIVRTVTILAQPDNSVEAVSVATIVLQVLETATEMQLTDVRHNSTQT
jgi:hypothetical protein